MGSTLKFDPIPSTIPSKPLPIMLDRIRVVLVRPKGSGNIGSVARAMKNTGLKDLTLVGGGRTETYWARAMAVHAEDILRHAQRFNTIREAVADCGLVVGTTCRSGLYRSHCELPRDVASAVVAAVQGNGGKPAALLFGPEDHGLSNVDLKHCQRLIMIPSHPEYASLNIAQAVMVCLYEIYLASLDEVEGEIIERATAESVEALFDRLKKTLLDIGFLDPQNPEHILLGLRRILGRAGLEKRDVRILSGLFRQVDWYTAGGGWEVAEEKRRLGIKLR
jgi:tRNA/rRNA methyltransferase